MQRELLQLKKEALLEITQSPDLDRLNEVRIKYLGRKGRLTLILRGLGNLPKDKRPQIGKLANEIKEEIEKAIDRKRLTVRRETISQLIEEEWVDITQPGTKLQPGHIHLVSQILKETVEIFLRMGFSIVSTPEVETVYYNFDFLNTDKTHPSRSLQDTFYISDRILLRTHCSTMQGRVMEKQKPPIKVISVGKTYRRDYDISHTPMFHQIDGLVISRKVNLGDLKGTLTYFAKEYFGHDRRIRFYGHFFPFTEPSLEMEIDCGICRGRGCRSCSRTGWIELLGCGMVHPYVLRNGGIDPKKYQGFAFGGITPERLGMLKYGISDARLPYENDIRFLKQF